MQLQATQCEVPPFQCPLSDNTSFHTVFVEKTKAFSVLFDLASAAAALC
jgi:hypothetical protein